MKRFLKDDGNIMSLLVGCGFCAGVVFICLSLLMLVMMFF